MPLTPRRGVRTRILAPAAALVTLAGLALSGLTAGPALAAPAGPDLVQGSAYLVAPANLIDGHFYESFPGYADFGLTIDAAFALAATGDQDSALKGIVTFLADGGKDPHGSTVNTWTGIGTRFVSGGSLGAEALLAEVAGDNPRDFGGHNLIAALDGAVCARPSSGASTSCAGAGNYMYSASVFDQALGIIAQLRAGQARQAARPIQYLESLRNSDGSFPSLIPDSHDHDVDSTAMAVMALALVPGAAAGSDVATGLAWIASHQEQTGGFPGASGDSVNSAGLAIQGLTLDAARYRPQIDAALAFLAHEQNSNGGFAAAATGSRASNVRASTQAVGGAAGTSFGTLRRNLNGTPPPPPTSPPPSRHHTAAAGSGPAPASTQAAAPQPSPTVTVTVTPAPAAAATSPPAPPVVPTVRRAFADASSTATLATDLWRVVIAAGAVAAVLIGLLYLRRRRLYPHRPHRAGS